MNRLFALVLVCTAVGMVLPAQAALTDPAQIQTEAYINLVQADQSLDAGRLDEALSQYKTARDYYAQLARDFPGWEPRVIQYRKTYCDNQIADVERRKAGGQPYELAELPPEPSPAPPASRAALTPAVAAPVPLHTPMAAASSVEVDYLKSRIASLESEQADFDALQEEVDDLTAEVEQLRQQLAQANAQLAAKASGDMTALEALQQEIAAKNEQIQSLQKTLDTQKDLPQALNDLEAKVNELRAQNERLNQEIKNLDQELDETERRAEEAEGRQKTAEKQAKQAEKDLQKARDKQAAAEKQLAMFERKPLFAKSEHQEPEEKPAARSEPTAPPAAELKPPVQSEAEPPAAVPAAAAPAPPPATTRETSKPVPAALVATDRIRQLLLQGDNDAALAAARDSRRAAPADMNLALVESIALIRLQRYAEAAATLIDLARNNPRNAEIHAALGAAMMGDGLYDEARETLLLAIKLDRNLPECLYNLAQLHAFIDPIDLKAARRYYRQARGLGLPADPQLEKALK